MVQLNELVQKMIHLSESVMFLELPVRHHFYYLYLFHLLIHISFPVQDNFLALLKALDSSFKSLGLL